RRDGTTVEVVRVEPDQVHPRSTASAGVSGHLLFPDRAGRPCPRVPLRADAGGSHRAIRGVVAMRALVVYESMFGNTRDVAYAVAEGLRRHLDVDVVEVGTAPTVLGE